MQSSSDASSNQMCITWKYTFKESNKSLTQRDNIGDLYLLCSVGKKTGKYVAFYQLFNLSNMCLLFSCQKQRRTVRRHRNMTFHVTDFLSIQSKFSVYMRQPEEGEKQVMVSLLSYLFRIRLYFLQRAYLHVCVSKYVFFLNTVFVLSELTQHGLWTSLSMQLANVSIRSQQLNPHNLRNIYQNNVMY